jgi:hypothetical protein
MKKGLMLVLGVACAAVMAGCSGETEPPAAADPRSGVAGDDQELVTQTIVTPGADGELHVTVKQVTRAQQRAEIEARDALVNGHGVAAGGHGENVGEAKQALIYQDSCNDGAALWLFSNTNLSGNELCLNGNGGDEANLGTWGWNDTVRSYWAGDKGGYFWNGTAEETFSPYQKVLVAGPVAQFAGIVAFGSPPPPTCSHTVSAPIDCGGTGWVEFNLPDGMTSQVYNLSAGRLNSYWFPLCHTIYWANISFQCTAGGKWTLINESTWADNFCTNTTFDTSQVAAAGFYGR